MIFFPRDINKIPELTGVYQFIDTDNTVIYIGKAKNLKRRISSYFRKTGFKDNKTAHLVKHINSIKIIILEYEFEALIYEANLIRTYKPKYNIIWKDDKHYIYIEITKVTFPKIILNRVQNLTSSDYYGPFPSTKIAAGILKDIRKIFPYCTQKKEGIRRCFYSHLGLCNPCPSDIKKEKGYKYTELKKEYLSNISKIRSLLNGNIKQIKNYLKKRMLYYSAKEMYEKATEYKNKITHLEYLSRNYRKSENYSDDIYGIENSRKKETSELINILKPFFTNMVLIKKIECYDISTTSGSLVVGSIVVFENGIMNKQKYKKFRIKYKGKSNDIYSLSEMIERRLMHTEWALPDLFIIDGGRPQLTAIRKIFMEKNLNIPYIGLAKIEEEIVVPSDHKFIKIKLSRSSSALRFIQRIRDEAHRYVHKYHISIRQKQMYQ